MKYFCMPSDFKDDTVNGYSMLNEQHEDSQIIETYGQLAPDTLFGSCRINSQLPEVDRDRLEKYVKYGRDRGIEFNYILNPTCMSNDDLTGEGYRKIKSFMEILSDIGVSSITAALPTIMEIAAYAVPGLKIKASTVCQINSPLKAAYYKELGVGRLVLDEDINRRFDILKNIRKVYDGKLEIIVNSFCSIDCPNKMFDYNTFSHSHTGEKTYPYYSTRCRHRHMGSDSFMKLNWIRPEDIRYYEETGIEYFKIQGRTTVYSGDPIKAVSHYMDGSYDGDLIRLLELFSVKKPLALAGCSIDNRKLDGFWNKFVNEPCSCTKVCGECGYCNDFAEASMPHADRILLDIMKVMDKYVLEEYPQCLEG